MMFSPWIKVKKHLRNANQWFRETPERALEQAYDAALKIKSIEDEHFNGKKISAESADYGDSVLSYFNAELKQYLKLIQVRLVEFNASRAVVDLQKQMDSASLRGDVGDYSGNGHRGEFRDNASLIFEKLAFIDGVISKYTKSQPSQVSQTAIVPLTKPSSATAALYQASQGSDNSTAADALNKNTVNRVDISSDEVSLLPRSLLGTLNRITRDLDPEAEKEVLKNFRNSKTKTVISLRFILLLILIPLLVQQLSKNFVVGPIVDRFHPPESSQIFLNQDLEEEAFKELQRFEENLKFKELVGLAPSLSPEEREKEISSKALEIAEQYRYESSNAVKNIFADVFSFISFAGLLFANKKQIEIFKSFLDDVIYGLSDSAKAFIIILFTDMFVGFHSPHGWEVILESISKHLGIPENRDFIFLFIATFPVILDAVFKYWIFRYLNRTSPSAVATYKNMNE